MGIVGINLKLTKVSVLEFLGYPRDIVPHTGIEEKTLENVNKFCAHVTL